MELKLTTEQCLALVKIIIPAQQERKRRPLSAEERKEVEVVDDVLRQILEEAKLDSFLQKMIQPGIHLFED